MLYITGYDNRQITEKTVPVIAKKTALHGFEVQGVSSPQARLPSLPAVRQVSVEQG